jgi:hypothetical protein
VRFLRAPNDALGFPQPGPDKLEHLRLAQNETERDAPFLWDEALPRPLGDANASPLRSAAALLLAWPPHWKSAKLEQ